MLDHFGSEGSGVFKREHHPRWAATYYLAPFCWKLHESEVGPRGVHIPSAEPGSFTTFLALYYRCQNGGTCTDGSFAYNCTCADNYLGHDCECKYADNIRLLYMYHIYVSHPEFYEPEEKQTMIASQTSNYIQGHYSLCYFAYKYTPRMSHTIKHILQLGNYI